MEIMAMRINRILTITFREAVRWMPEAVQE